MELPFSLDHPAVPWRRGLPPEGGHLFGGAQAFHARWADGGLLLQKASSGDHTLIHGQGSLSPGARLVLVQHMPLVGLHLALQGSYSWQGMAAQSLKEGQFNLCCRPAGALTVTVTTAGIAGLELALPSSYLHHFSASYPVLAPFLGQVAQGREALLGPRPFTASRNMVQRAQRLLHHPYQEVLRNMFMEAQVTELLLEALEIATGHRAALPPVSPEEMERIAAVRQLLDAQLDRRLTVAQLARRAHMNVVKLNQGFRLLTGTTLFDYHLARRMERARELLASTRLLLEEIAEETGYEHLSSFIAAFKALHGMTPATYRRSKGH